MITVSDSKLAQRRMRMRNQKVFQRGGTQNHNEMAYLRRELE